MSTSSATLLYGCPMCSPREKETGEFTEQTVEKRTALRKFLWHLRLISSPAIKVSLKLPVKNLAYEPIEVYMDSSRISSFSCPHCRSKLQYQLKQWKGAEYLHWSVAYSDGSVLLFEVHDCKKCGGRLTVYIQHLKYDDVAQCRACRMTRRGEHLGGYDWTNQQHTILFYANGSDDLNPFKVLAGRPHSSLLPGSQFSFQIRSHFSMEGSIIPHTGLTGRAGAPCCAHGFAQMSSQKPDRRLPAHQIQ